MNVVFKNEWQVSGKTNLLEVYRWTVPEVARQVRSKDMLMGPKESVSMNRLVLNVCPCQARWTFEQWGSEGKEGDPGSA